MSKLEQAIDTAPKPGYSLLSLADLGNNSQIEALAENIEARIYELIKGDDLAKNIAVSVWKVEYKEKLLGLGGDARNYDSRCVCLAQELYAGLANRFGMRNITKREVCSGKIIICLRLEFGDFKLEILSSGQLDKTGTILTCYLNVSLTKVVAETRRAVDELDIIS